MIELITLLQTPVASCYHFQKAAALRNGAASYALIQQFILWSPMSLNVAMDSEEMSGE
jgi:hypothetical protein